VSSGGRGHGGGSWYVRTLRLRHVRPGGVLSFVLFECVIALAVLMALAELVSWWAVAVLPVAVAAMVKVNDMVSGAEHPAGRAVPAEPEPPAHDDLSTIDTPPFAVPPVDETASVLRLRSSRVYKSEAREAAEAAMEAALVEAEPTPY
jgi:hypothetical protein